MCGRFVATNSAAQLAAFFETSPDGPDLESNYNVAPTTDVIGVVSDADGQRRLEAFRWGFVPSWADDVRIGSRMINARAETLGEKPSFRRPLQRTRLIIPMDGFYEWRTTPTGKQPVYIHGADGLPLAVAGLWTTWRDPSCPPDEGWLHSCTVITTAANGTMRPVHDRMPVLLDRSRWTEWLDPANHDVSSLRELLVPAADDLLVMHRVGTEVNSVRNRGPHLREPVGELDL